MASGFLKFLKHLFFPHGFLFLLILLAPRYIPLPRDLWIYADFYPLLLFAMAAAFCWRFHKDRCVFAIVSMALCERALYFLFAGPEGAIGHGAPVYTAMAVLLPLNLVFFELVSDRGVFTFRGSMRWLLIAAEAGCLGIVYVDSTGARAAELQTLLDSLSYYLPSAHPDPVPAAFGAALLILLVRFAIRRAPFESSSLWVLMLLYLGISGAGGDRALAAYYLSFASLIYIGAVVDTSYRLAFHDELTGLPARRALNDHLMRLSSKYAIAMADIDHFKKFNDTYGHDVGDQVLKMVASKLGGVAGGGRAFRYGGEEFAIVFSGGSVERAKPCLEALRHDIETKKFTLRGFGRAFRQKKPAKSNRTPQRKTVRITVSIGVAEKNDRHPDPGAVLKAADRALYRAKRAGRNRVAV